MTLIAQSLSRTKHGAAGRSHALDGDGALLDQLAGVALVALLLAVLEVGAVVGLQQPVLGAEVAAAEPAVADDPLHLLLALVRRLFLVVARRLLRHPAAQGERYVQRCFAPDGQL